MALDDNLQTLTRDELILLVIELRSLARQQLATLTDIVDQRDAALLLNELCHFGKDDPCFYDVNELRNPKE
jgi:hypothetical protein